MAYSSYRPYPRSRWERIAETLKGLGAIAFFVIFALLIIFLISLPFLWWGFIVWAVVKLLAILAAAVAKL